MNHSSLFSFEESSVWDPKVIMKRLIVPQDQLAKLNSIPGWTKVQDNQNILRLDKDFSIEGFHSECSVNVTQNNQRIEKNKELFDEQIENHKSVLETYKVYSKKLTRSLSFFAINKSCENLFNSKTLKRSSSLQSIYQLSDISGLAERFKTFRCENSAKRHLPSDHSEHQKREDIFLSKEINSKTMETVSQLPVIDTSTPAENVILHSGGSKENCSILSTENIVRGLKELICTADQPTKHLIESVNALIDSETTSTPAENVILHSGSSKENRNILLAGNAARDAARGLKELICTADDQPTNHFIESVNALIHSETIKENNDVLCVINTESHSETTKESNDVLHADNADLYSLTTKENNCVLPIETATSESNNIPDQLVKHDTESTNANNTDLQAETTKESNGVSIVSTALCSNNASDETAKTVVNDSVISDNYIISSVDKVCPYESHVPVSSENYKSDKNDVKKVLANKISTTFGEYEVIETFTETYPSTSVSNADDVKLNPDTETSVSIECFPSGLNSGGKNPLKLAAMERNNDINLPELRSSKSSAVDIPAKELFLPNKEAEPKPSVQNSGSDMKGNCMENDKKECDGKTCDLSKSSGIDETSVTKKRKLESRNKRSKRLKSEEKKGNLKIRSIKKVGEICYSAEEVKTMLDIMKQLL